MPKKKYLLAQELSWIQFNGRVLQEAQDLKLPLKHRIRFLGIFSNNQDEFFRLKIALLKRMIKYSNDGHMYSKETLENIHRMVTEQQEEFASIWKKILIELKKDKVFLVRDKLTLAQKKFVQTMFDDEISSSIIPLLIDHSKPFHSFKDNQFFLGIAMYKEKGEGEPQYAIIEIPTRNHPRFIFLPARRGVQNIMLLEDLIRYNLPKIFSHLGYTHFEAYTFKVTRDAEIDIDDDVSTPFIKKIEQGIKNRQKAPAIRFVYDKKMNRDLLQILTHKLGLMEGDSILPGGPIRNFVDFMDFPADLPDATSQPKPFKHPALANSLTVYDVVSKQDVLLNVPYHSFNSIIDMVREAAMDPDVRQIKITGYRLAPNSKICNALINAVRNGKEVYVVLELRASFHEAANLEWKAKLEEEGVKVFVNFTELKVHAKVCIIKKQTGPNQYIHYGFIGTGNLNEKTALTYIDDFLLTSNKEIMSDLDLVFQALEHPEGQWKLYLSKCKTLLVPPVKLRKALTNKIKREIEFAKAGKEAKIILLLNSLSDEKLIKKLYKAADAGVEVHLIVRGIFCASLDNRTFSKPIKAISIVDEYLEHTRVYLFHNGGDDEIYIASADWMVRNLDKRVEVAVPILDKTLKDEIRHILQIKLSDNVKARYLDKETPNQFVESSQLNGKSKPVRSQRAIYYYLKRKTADNYHENRSH